MSGFGDFNTPGATLGPDRARRPYASDARFWITSARWVQRAINAWRTANPGHGGMIYVDGRAGPITMAALRDLSPAISENFPEGSRVTNEVLIDRALADRLAELPVVTDPPRPATSSRPSDVTEPVILDEGSVRSPWLYPVVGVGVIALLGAIGFVMWRRRSSRALSSPRSFKGLGCGCDAVPAKGDPRGHVTASALRGLRRRKR